MRPHAQRQERDANDASVLDGLVLIADGGASRVFVVNPAGQVVWQYGPTGQPGSGADRLAGPMFAQWVPNGGTSATWQNDGNVAICDA